MRTRALIVILLATQIAAHARKCIVGPQATRTIKEALALTADCDTVVVKSGHYREGTITLERSVVLLGEGWPIIDGEGAGEVVVVKAPHVTITGFVVRGTAISDLNDNAGIKCISTTDIVIAGNRVEGCFFGIYLSSVARAVVADNQVIGDAATQENRRTNGIH